MQIILIEDVKSLGKKGTIVNVNDSYGRNYIIPRKLGVEANSANLNDLKLKNANAEKLEAARVQSAKDVKALIDGKTVKLGIKAGKDGKVFGSITAKEVAAEIEKQFKTTIDKKKIVMDPIKTTGMHDVTVKLHKEISAVVKVAVGEA